MSTPSTIAFVAGATGYTGREVVRLLVSRGVRTIAHVRPDSKRKDEWRARFEAEGAEVDATPWDDAALTATFAQRKPTLVFALLGTTRARAKEIEKQGGDAARETYEAVDYGLSAMLLRASIAEGTRPRYVYLSSLGVSDDARGGYFQARARLERELVASGLPHVIGRPSFITGESERDEPRPMERIGAGVGDALLSAVALFGGRGLRDRYASIDPKTLATALVDAALAPTGDRMVLEGSTLRGR
ncbi:Putative nucleoside-diphosphate-sugar epimerase [Minicystis rosea]|nr:Putative nucleoside-diphosphate-sugar epimerase [Minicystis rosea]